MNNKKGEHFNSALIVILLSIAVSLLAFMGENKSNKVTGYAISDSYTQDQSDLLQFKSVSSLGTLTSGRYYIDGESIVYWMDDNSRPAIGKITYLSDSQRNREVYVDKDGNVGYIIG